MRAGLILRKENKAVVLWGRLRCVVPFSKGFPKAPNVNYILIACRFILRQPYSARKLYYQARVLLEPETDLKHALWAGR